MLKKLFALLLLLPALALGVATNDAQRRFPTYGASGLRGDCTVNQSLKWSVTLGWVCSSGDPLSIHLNGDNWTAVSPITYTGTSLSLAGLSGFGTAGQQIRVNAGANGFEYFTSSSSGITGTLTSGRVPVASGASTLTDSANFLYDTTTRDLTIDATTGVGGSYVRISPYNSDGTLANAGGFKLYLGGNTHTMTLRQSSGSAYLESNGTNLLIVGTGNGGSQTVYRNGNMDFYNNGDYSWGIDSSRNFFAQNDNVVDVGIVGGRPRTVRVGTSVITPAVFNTATQTTITGAAGTAVCSQPERGASYKKVVCHLAGFTNTADSYTFPTAFSFAPYVYGDSVVTAITTDNTTTLTLTGSVAITGYVFAEGY